MTVFARTAARTPLRAPPRAAAVRVRGGPLVMLVLLLGGWSSARAVWWESPVVLLASPHEGASELLAAVPSAPFVLLAPNPQPAVVLRLKGPNRSAPGSRFEPAASGRPRLHRSAVHGDPGLATDHPMLWRAAPRGASGRPASTGDEGRHSRDASTSQAGRSDMAPFLPEPAAIVAAGRWSLDTWAFWREGSDAGSVSQGRLPIYGASQAGAVLQYRVAPGTHRDPRLYARAYRALVEGGESEFALGASLRPLRRVPLRLAGEVRYTDATLFNDWRPAAYLVTEIPPVNLPRGTRLEAYGQAGWVGGTGATTFADGQVSLTGELKRIARLSDNALRLSIGAAAWGGAQKGAHRVDIGPTLRFDFAVGSVPARASLEWRQRVGGEAAPDSGLAATVSTQF